MNRVPVVAATAVGLGGMALVGVAGVAYWLIPRLTRPDIFFAVTVDPAFRRSAEGRAIQKRFEQRIILHSLIGAAIVALAMLRPSEGVLIVLFMAGILWQSMGAFVSFLAARRQTLPHAAPSALVREAALVPRRIIRVGGWLAQAGPFVILGLFAAYVALHWQQIPNRFPIHWGIDGKPNGWGNRSIVSVFGPHVMGVMLCGLFAFIAVSLQVGLKRSRPGDQESQFLRLTLWLLLLVEYMMAGMMGFIGLTPVFSTETGTSLPWWLIFLFEPIIIIFVGWFMVRSGQGGWKLPETVKAPADGVVGDATPDDRWLWGVFYVNADDPAIWVQKRFGIGYTPNFGNPRSWLLMGGFVLFVAATIGLAVAMGNAGR